MPRAHSSIVPPIAAAGFIAPRACRPRLELRVGDHDDARSLPRARLVDERLRLLRPKRGRCATRAAGAAHQPRRIAGGAALAQRPLRLGACSRHCRDPPARCRRRSVTWSLVGIARVRESCHRLARARPACATSTRGLRTMPPHRAVENDAAEHLDAGGRACAPATHDRRSGPRGLLSPPLTICRAAAHRGQLVVVHRAPETSGAACVWKSIRPRMGLTGR